MLELLAGLLGFYMADLVADLAAGLIVILAIGNEVLIAEDVALDLLV